MELNKLTQDQEDHRQLQELAVEIWTKTGVSRERAVNDAADAIEEARGIDLSECRASEIENAKKADEAEKGRSGA